MSNDDSLDAFLTADMPAEEKKNNKEEKKKRRM